MTQDPLRSGTILLAAGIAHVMRGQFFSGGVFLFVSSRACLSKN